MHVGMYDCMRSDRIRVRQPAVRYTQKSKQTNMHTRVSVYVCVHEERERISVTLVTTAAQGRASDLCMCARVCWYHFAHLSTASVCLPVHAVTQTHTHTHASNTKNTGKYMASNDRKSTLLLKHSISVLSHDKHAHSLKR